MHYNRVALRALLRPEGVVGPMPKHAKPPPRLMPYYLDFTNRGYLSPEVQLRKQRERLGLAK